MFDAALTTLSASPEIDSRHLDATLSSLRRAGRDVAGMADYLSEARDRLAGAPDDPEARHAVRMSSLRMRADAHVLAQQFQALAREGAP